MVMADTIQKIGVSEETYYRWRKEYHCMATYQLKWFKEVEKVNQRLRTTVSDLILDKPIPQEANSEKY